MHYKRRKIIIKEINDKINEVKWEFSKSPLGDLEINCDTLYQIDLERLLRIIKECKFNAQIWIDTKTEEQLRIIIHE